MGVPPDPNILKVGVWGFKPQPGPGAAPLAFKPYIR